MRNHKALLLASAVMLVAGGANAETYRWSQWQPDTEATTITNRWVAEAICEATNNEVCFEVFSGGVLMPAKSHLQGIGDGVVQAGNVTGGYTPSDLPMTNALSPYFFVEPDATTIGAAFADWAMHSDLGKAEWQGHNVVPLGGFSTPAYPIICNTSQPITELEQLQGLKIRFPGGANATLAQDLGAIPVNIPAPEIYQALETGQIDCAGILAGWLNIDNSLEEVSKSTTVMNWASSFISPLISFNKTFWQGLTNEQRAEILKIAARGHAKAQIKFNTDNQKALDTAAGNGHQVVEPGESIQKAVADWVAAGVGDMAGVAKNTYGVQDPEALFASFQPYVEKWAPLIANMKDKNNEDELTQVLYDNMFADLDPAAYGMN